MLHIKLSKLKITVFFLNIALVGLISFFLIYNQGLQVRHSSDKQVSDLSQQLNNKIIHDNFETAKILAQHELVKQYLENPTPQIKTAIELSLDSTKLVLSAAIIYIMDNKGTVIASTIYGENKSLLNKNYKFRPYFSSAINGKNTVYPALGVTTGKRGLYFSVPIYKNKIKSRTPIGVLVIKQNLDKIDSLLRKSTTPSFLTINNGVIFASKQHDLMYKSILKLSPSQIGNLKRSQQFADIEILPTPFDLNQQKFKYQSNNYFSISKNIDFQNWQLHMLIKKFNYPYFKIAQVTFIIILLELLIFVYIRLTKNRKKVIENQKKTEEKFMKLFYSSSDAMLLIDEEHFIDCNQAAAQMLGYKDDKSLLLIHPSKLSPPFQEDGQDSEEKANMMISIAMQMGVNRFEWIHKKKNGELFPVDVSLAMTPISINGKSIIHTILRDLTQIKQAEADLVQAKELAEQSSQAKSEFLSSMSHELRTPMNAILGFSQVLEYDDTLNDEQKDNVNEILKAGKHLLDLINKVLDLAKIESGHIELSIQAVQLTSLVNDCFLLITPMADKLGISISHNDIDDYFVRADKTCLKQILLNLLSNAIKYNCKQGTVELNVTPVNKTEIRITITDTGKGIAWDKQDELFQPFNRLDAEDSGIEGTGIGLSITRNLVELMGGRIGVDSEPGIGSHFWLELPKENLPNMLHDDS